MYITTTWVKKIVIPLGLRGIEVCYIKLPL